MILKRPAIVINKTSTAEQYLAVAAFIPIARWRHVPSSFRLSNQVEKQLKTTPGIVAYSMAVDLPRRHFWTYTGWSDADTVGPFTQAQPHAAAVERFNEWAGDGAAFVRWESPSSDIDWDEAFRRLKQPSFSYQKPE